MKKRLGEAIEKLLLDLEAFDIDHQAYFDDVEPQSWYDAALTGKTKSLLAYCRTLGLAELVSTVEILLPLHTDSPSALEQLKTYVIPEVRRHLQTTNVETVYDSDEGYWQLIHPRIRHLAWPRFQAGFHGDAVESAFKEVNDAVKEFVKGQKNKELDGSSLMTFAFSPSNPVISLECLDTETGRSIQQGYMQIFAGAMTDIRNPKAHGNLQPDTSRTFHLICLASLLMTKFDERVDIRCV